MLLKIYCENIVVAFLNCHFLFFILFFLSTSSIHFFFLLFFLHHTLIPTLAPFFFFFYLILDHSLSLSSSLFFYFFFSYLILEHSLALYVIRNKERTSKRLAPPLIEGHRQAQNRRSLCQATPSALLLLIFLPNIAPMGQMASVFSFLFIFCFYCYDLINFKIVLLSLYFDLMLEFRDV